MTEIELVEISKEYQKGTKAVNCVSFSVLPGEFLVLVGPSGCGKSSLLRMIAGLESITEGELLFNKKIMNSISPEKRNIGMVFQNYALYPHLSVFDNLAFPLKVIKVKKNEIKDRVNQIAEMINLTEYLTFKPKELSGGQRQRVALGRALIRKPDVFLFDEPLSNLDAKLRVQMRTEIVNLHSSVKTTSIYVTHDQTEAMTMGDRLVILDKGRIQQIDTPHNLYKNPGNKFVAGFLGSPQMNFMEGILYRDNGIYFRENDSEFTIKLNISDDLKIDANPNYTLGVRPEDIKIPTEINSNSNVFTAIVKNVEYLGFEKIIYFITGGNLKSIRLQANDDIKPGDKFNYSINSIDTYLFDINGERIG